jgi:hypothetical protein
MDEVALPYQMLSEAVGIPIKIISNEFKEFHGNSHHKIVFQIKEEDPDIFTFSVLFALSLMSFTFSAPRGYSEIEFIPDEEWTLEYFVQGLSFQHGSIKYSGDYVSGRHMKTNIVFESGGRVTVETRNRGRGADRWILHLQGKKHIQPVSTI